MKFIIFSVLLFGYTLRLLAAAVCVGKGCVCEENQYIALGNVLLIWLIALSAHCLALQMGV